MQLDSKIPEGPLAEKWDKCRFSNKLVNPANKRKYEVIIVGTGLAGPSRDMMIRQSTPVGATGRVYGAVYSGLDIGFALAAPVFGWMMDQGWVAAMFHGAALTLLLSVGSAALVGGHVAHRAKAAV